MEYRDFEYTNELGVVQLEHGSQLGMFLSQMFIRALQITLIAAALGFGYASYKYFTLPAPVKIVAMANPEAAVAAPLAVIDYHVTPPPAGLTASAAALSGGLVSKAMKLTGLKRLWPGSKCNCRKVSATPPPLHAPVMY